MAACSKQVLLLAVIAAVACLASPASATQWVVGDQCGWRSNFNETCWADGKTFVVGDTLKFVYTKDTHTVVQVGEHDFAACNLVGNQLGAWRSGNDIVPLEKPGKMWFICTKPNHCLNGMKLAIDVVDHTVAPSPSPLPFPGVPVPATAPSPLFRWPYFCPWVSTPAPAPASTAAAPPAPGPAPASPAAAPPALAPASPAAAPHAPAPASPAAAPPAATPGSPAAAPSAPTPAAPPAPAPAPSSAVVINPVGSAVAVAAAAMVAVAVALAF